MSRAFTPEVVEAFLETFRQGVHGRRYDRTADVAREDCLGLRIMDHNNANERYLQKKKELSVAFEGLLEADKTKEELEELFRKAYQDYLSSDDGGLVLSFRERCKQAQMDCRSEGGQFHRVLEEFQEALNTLKQLAP